MNHEMTLRFQSELEAGEHILWCGQPKQGLLLRPSDAFLIPFSLFWAGFAIFWEVMAFTGEAPFFFMLWGIPFVLVGLYFLAGRFFVDARQREKTYYALTNERVIILSGLFGRSVRSLSLKTLSEVNLSAKDNGRGTITFGPSQPVGGWYAGAGWPGMGKYAPPAFEMIEDARQVYTLLRKAQRER
jgi:hypothetical protein